jgi:Branched-chain amino acid ABC-type transport system, permease components
MRAYSDSEDLALLFGIDPKRIVTITWMIDAILATIGGVLYGLDKSSKPFTYFNNMLPIFAAAIVGGIGNPFGAFMGGYVIAFCEIFLTYAYKKFFMYVLPESMEPDGLIQLLSTDYKCAVSFSILVIVLLYRPSGIFKGKIFVRKNLNVIAAYSIMMGLIILVGVFQSWNIALSIFNLCLISGVMTMGANIQWGYAGLINFGIMGFTALGGLDAVLICVNPVQEAWSAGGTNIVLSVFVIIGIVLAVRFVLQRYQKSKIRNYVIAYNYHVRK